MASLILGGGREKKTDEIDMSVGIELKKALGDRIEKDTPFAFIHGNDKDKIAEAKKRLLGAYTLSEKPVEKQACVYEVKMIDVCKHFM